VLGERIDGPEDIARIAAAVGYNSMDLLQAAHTFSGVEIALWDLIGKARGLPAWRLLGYRRSFEKTPYASQLFGHTPQATLELARAVRAQGFRAVKFGWGPYGRGSVALDADQVNAAREGLGKDGMLLIDAGQIWGEDTEAAAKRLPALESADVTWLEEPFHGSAFEAYRLLAQRGSRVRLAGGEAAHNSYMAQHLMEYGQVGFIQIDCGRIGGLGPAKRVVDLARARGVTYVNHTFTSHLALSASMQPYAGVADHRLCEYPVALQPVARDISTNHILPDANGDIAVPDGAGLGIEVNTAAFAKYLVPVEIAVKGKTLYRTPAVD
jgi:L-alanine-DL-glutamate epimerase-like enolase superfamily enzyme